MKRLRAAHRITGVTIFIVLIYLSITGLMIQAIDLKLIFTHAPLTDPDMMTMLEIPGGGYQILTVADLTAQALPADADVNAMTQKVMESVRPALGAEPLRFIEFRMADGKPVGQVQTRRVNATFDGVTGALLHQEPVQPQTRQGNRSLRYRLKDYHRLTVFGNYAPSINVFIALALFTMVVTGVTLYILTWKAREKAGASGFFWVAGDWKRAMHRMVGIVAAIFLIVVSFSGFWLAYESAYLGINVQRALNQRKAAPPANAPAPNGAAANGAAPNGQGANGAAANGPAPNRGGAPTLKDADIPAMMQVTVDAARSALHGAPVKVIRIRNYTNHVQGVVVTGEGNDTSQLVFNAQTGQPPSEAEEGISQSLFPFGWDAHQLGKAIHRGSYFGLWARFLDFFAGLSLLYLSINGIALYIDIWLAEKKARKAASAAS